MKLSERMKHGKNGVEEHPSFGTVSTRAAGAAEAKSTTTADPVRELKRRAQEALIVRMGPALWDVTSSATQLDAQVVRELSAVLKEEKIPLNDAEREQLVGEIIDQALGYGPIERYLDDPTVSEVMVNGINGVYIEREGRLEETDAEFFSEQHVLRVIDRIVAPLGRRVDEASPMVDARLPDGSRVNAIIAPLAVDGPQLTIRKFTSRVLTLQDLVQLGTMTEQVGGFLAACVAGRVNILISGGTGSGKTTLLNVLSSMIPETERIVTIEDAAELRLQQRHVIRLESRPANIEGRGEVQTRDLVRNALRMRPDRIVVGEVPRRRGARHAAGDEHRARRFALDAPRELATRTRSPEWKRWF